MCRSRVTVTKTTKLWYVVAILKKVLVCRILAVWPTEASYIVNLSWPAQNALTLYPIPGQPVPPRHVVLDPVRHGSFDSHYNLF